MKATTLVAVLLVAAIATVGVAGVAAGQDSDDGDGPGIEVNPVGGVPDNVSTELVVDEDLRVIQWFYDDEREGFEITFEVDRRTQVTITEAVQFAEGSGQGRIYQQRLASGHMEIFVKVPRRGGEAAVTMTTAKSIENYQYKYLSTGESDPERPSIKWSHAQMLILLVATGAVGMTLRIVRKKRADDDKDSERIL